MNSAHAVAVRNLTRNFGKFTAVDHIEFAVKDGEIFGFLGANGAGKTTTIRMLCGILLPSAGANPRQCRSLSTVRMPTQERSFRRELR